MIDLLIHEPCNEAEFRSRPGGIGQRDLSIDVTREDNAMLRARCAGRNLFKYPKISTSKLKELMTVNCER